MQKDLSPSGFAVTTRPSELCEVGIHMCGSTRPQEKLRKEI